MFKIFYLYLLCLACSATASVQAANPRLATGFRIPLILRAGTQVSLSLNQEVNPNEVAVGNAIEFIVRSNVTVNGRVVIAAGSIAVGIVRQTTPSRKKKPGSITIAVESVQAVDNQSVNLNSTPHFFKVTKNQPNLTIGTLLTSHVRNDIKINA